MVAGGTIQNFHQLLGSNFVFEVPDFQRNYSWEPQQVEELYWDILKSKESDLSHFIGSLILLREDGSTKPIQVVDGQQRLTTLFMLIAAIRDAATELSVQNIVDPNFGHPIQPVTLAHNLLMTQGQTPTFRFIAHPIINAMFRKHILAFPTPEREPLPKRHYTFSLALRKGFFKLVECLKASMAELADDADRLRFLHSLLLSMEYNLHILTVNSTNQVESYEIFMTLNSRGLPLGPSDLVKSEIFKHLTANLQDKHLEQKNAELTSDWNALLFNLDKGDLDQFLRHFLVSKYEGKLTSKKIFEKVHELINGTRELPKDPVFEAKSFLNDMLAGSALYAQLLEANVVDLPKAADSLKLLVDLADSYRIFALAVIDPKIKLATNERQELIRLTEVLALRWVLVGLNAQKLEDNFQLLSLALRNGAPFFEVKSMLKSYLPADDIVRAQFNEPVESPNLVRIVLHKIDNKWDHANLIAREARKIHVEHIAPASKTDHWLGVLFPDNAGVERDVEYEVVTELWGNKTILENRINQSVKQRPFIEKARGSEDDLEWLGYVNSKLAVTEDLGKNLTHWGRNDIAKRGRWIAEMFLNIWAVDPDSDGVVLYSQWSAKN